MASRDSVAKRHHTDLMSTSTRHLNGRCCSDRFKRMKEGFENVLSMKLAQARLIEALIDTASSEIGPSASRALVNIGR